MTDPNFAWGHVGDDIIPNQSYVGYATFYGNALIPSATGMQGYAYTCYIPEFGLIWEATQTNKILFYLMRDDMTVKEAVFYKAFGMKAPYAMKMVYNDDYIFGVSGSYIYYAPRPKYWTVPTAGAGAGAETSYITREYIPEVSITEGLHASANVEITLLNNDSKFDTPLDYNIAPGNLIKVYGGLYKAGTEYLNEINEYFISCDGYGRRDNLATYHIYCIDGWGKLEEYIFPNPIHFNEFEDNPLYPVPRYSAYEIIEKILNAIGCTLEKRSMSNFINEFYPRYEIKTGTVGASIVRDILSGKVTDKLIFRGTKGILIDPKKNDEPTAHMIFPKYS
jgi:hypothetical protein